MMHQATGACGMTLSPGSSDTARPFKVVLVSTDMGLSLCLGQKCCSALPAPVHPLPGASLTPRSFLAIGILTPQSLPLHRQPHVGPMGKGEQGTGSTASLPGSCALRTVLCHLGNCSQEIPHPDRTGLDLELGDHPLSAPTSGSGDGPGNITWTPNNPQ